MTYSSKLPALRRAGSFRLHSAHMALMTDQREPEESGSAPIAQKPSAARRGTFLLLLVAIAATFLYLTYTALDAVFNIIFESGS